MNPYLEVSPRQLYLAHLSERLDNLGYDILISELPSYPIPYLLKFLGRLGIPYCAQCQLPCAPEDMDSVIPNTCKEHVP